MSPSANKRVLIVPRWSGHPSSDFYPWLATHHEVEALALVEPSAPAIEANVAHLTEALETAVRRDGHAPWLLGHSVGCQVVMRAAARWRGAPLPGALLVAAWFTVDEPWPTLLPWLNTPLDDRATAANLGVVRALISDNDPFTSDHVGTKEDLERRLGGTVRVEPGAKHFNASEEPSVLAELDALLNRRRPA